MRERRPCHSRRAILNITRDLRREWGDRLTFRRFRGLTRVSVQSINDLFGSWEGLLQAAGDDPWHGPTNEEIVEELRQVARLRGNWITQEDFARHVGLTVGNLYRRFGSWRALREAAGLWRKSRPGRLYTNRELLDPALWLYLKYARIPLRSSYEHFAGKLAATAIVRRFGGSWAGVKRALEIYLQYYFLAHDPNWTKSEHEQTYQPDLNAKVRWPAELDGLDWFPNHGWKKLPKPWDEIERSCLTQIAGEKSQCRPGQSVDHS